MSRLERAVLGAILSNGQLFEQAAEIRPADFALDSHRIIFARMGDLAAAGRPIDILTVVEELERHKELQSVGDVGYVASLMEGILELPSIQHHVQTFRDAAGRSRAAKLGEKVQLLAEDPSVPTAALAAIGSDLKDIASGIERLPPRFSEEALALRFSEEYAEDLRYLSRWGSGCDGMG